MEAGLVAPAPIWSNLKTFNPKPFRGVVDIILGGYPCQPFSYAGNRAGTEDPRHLWSYLYKIVDTVRPVQCFFENVAGHLSMGFPEVYRGLRDLGYRVESGIYTASEVGAPHERERLFILAILENAGELGARGRDNGSTQRHGCQAETTRPGGELANANVSGLRRDNKGRFQPKIIRTDTKVADSDHDARRLSEAAGRDQGPKAQRRGTELANADHHGQDGSEIRQSHFARGYGGTARAKDIRESQRLRSSGPGDRFPAGQGAFQFEWEEPRTIESSLVYTIDGYNFTEDLHRAIGNSVVEQTAELAYIDLMRKHFPAWGPF